jgi:hypothetical protein
MTLRLFFRVLLGVLLFVCGLILGVWLIIRFRRRHPEGVSSAVP